jgi:hypothetical protein
VTRITLQMADDNSLDIDQIKFLDQFDGAGVSLTLLSPNGTLDLDDITIGFALTKMLIYTKQMVVHTPKATVTNHFADKMRVTPQWNRLRVDSILLTAPISAPKYTQAADFLKTISRDVFGVIERESDLIYAKTSGLTKFVFRLKKFVLPDTFDGFPQPTTFVTKW